MNKVSTLVYPEPGQLIRPDNWIHFYFLDSLFKIEYSQGYKGFAVISSSAVTSISKSIGSFTETESPVRLIVTP